MSYLAGRKIEAMHRYYGVDPGRGICADCHHLKRYQAGNKVVYKCVLYGTSHSVATDWRKQWEACALISHDPEPDNFVPVFERVQHEPRRHREPPLKGQMDVEDFLNE